MPLEIGQKLDHYEIVEPIGKGGMGEVYRAKDSKLGRDVAIKVLPDEFARDEERLRRFQREAKVLASLNHPNIASIYGLEQSGDTHYLVLELVPGETVAERIARGPIPVEQALEIATKIADALEEAHERGIVHRDLKPANIKLTPDDKVKVLDFGLAKAFVEEGAEGGAVTSMSPTVTKDATRVGVILGTAAYMSPEQARGERVDKRADVWAFGAVLYEMLSGKRAFSAGNVAETLALVLTLEPEWGLLPDSTSPLVRRVIRKCLTKNVHERIHDIADARIELQDPVTVFSVVDDGLAARKPAASGIALTLVLGVAIGIVLSRIAAWGLRADRPLNITRFAVTLPEGESITLANQSHDIAISPDGSRIVFKTTYAGTERLLVRAMDQTTPTLLAGLDPNTTFSPFVSPDSTWIGFHDEVVDTLKKISILGGPVVSICRTPREVRGASWGSDDTIVFGTIGDGLYRVAASGGEPEALTTLAPGEEAHRWPDVLPTNKGVLYTVYGGESDHIAVLDLESGDTSVLLRTGSYPRYSHTGHLVYGLDGSIFAVPFDVERMKIMGDPVPVVDDIVTKGNGAAGFDLSRTGTLTYLSGDVGMNQRLLVWVDRDGRVEPLDISPRVYHEPKVSPDGSRIVAHVQEESGSSELWMFDIERGTSTRLTFDPGLDEMPLWTPDGSRIVFFSSRDEGGLFVRAADGTGPVERFGSRSIPHIPMAWSADGATLVTVSRKSVEGDAGGGLAADIGIVAVQGESSGEWLLETKFRELRPAISPDGHWMAYDSDESGRPEVYVRPFPNVDGGRWQISTKGGRAPMWSADGTELFYGASVLGEMAMMRVPIQRSPSFSHGSPEILFEGTYLLGVGDHRMYDLAPDGRFIMVVQKSPSTPAQLNVVLNWDEELERLVPTDN